VAGVFHVLAREHGVRFDTAPPILDRVRRPERQGRQLVAAIEAATMEAVIAAWPLPSSPGASAALPAGGEPDRRGAVRRHGSDGDDLGEAGSLMALLCQPAEFQGSIRLPDELGVWGIDSGIRHAVTGADYGAVRVGAFMGYRILATLAGLRGHAGDREGHVRVDDPRWHGYLANVGATGFRRFAPDIPRNSTASAFLAQYRGRPIS
jgi:L-arabinokinase